MIILLVVVSMASGAFARTVEQTPAAQENDHLIQTRPIAIGRNLRRTFCDGREVDSEAKTSICCSIFVGSTWSLDLTIPPADRIVRYALKSKDYGYLSLAPKDAGRFEESDYYSLSLRCNRSPDARTIDLAFGGVFRLERHATSAWRTPRTRADATRVARLPFDFAENRLISLDAEALVIVTHAANQFDEGSFSREGVQALFNFARSKALPTLAVINDPNGASSQLYAANQPNYLAVSSGGQLNLEAGATTSFIFGGGNLSKCLCETIRDASRSAFKSASRVNVFLPTDAIYSTSNGLPERGSAWKYQIRQSSPSFLHGNFLLADFVAAIDVAGGLEDLVGYLRRQVIRFIPERSQFWSFCGQNTFDQIELDRESTAYQIVKDGLVIAEIQPGRMRLKTLRLILTTTARLEGDLLRWRD